MYLRLFFSVFVIRLNFINTQSLDTRIVGGVVATAHIPYQVALNINGYFSCGGSLITKNCVLTAAHCVKGRAASDFKVRAGILKLSSTGGASRTVSQTFVPNEYNANTLNYDVAILKLSSPLTGTNIGTIALNTVVNYIGDKFTVSGWGVTKESGSLSDQLRYVVVPAIAKATCNVAYSGAVTSTMFCATAKGKDSCSGDSGGPVVKDNRLYGIVSWGYGCARANYAGVYTNVKQVLPWINSIKTKYC